jgi:hypothetical protein
MFGIAHYDASDLGLMRTPYGMDLQRYQFFSLSPQNLYPTQTVATEMPTGRISAAVIGKLMPSLGLPVRRPDQPGLVNDRSEAAIASASERGLQWLRDRIVWEWDNPYVDPGDWTPLEE